MIDDIVTRIRKHQCTVDFSCPCADDAADEIERLRKENAELLAEIQEVHEEYRW
jgi:hypothetical protein